MNEVMIIGDDGTGDLGKIIAALSNQAQITIEEAEQKVNMVMNSFSIDAPYDDFFKELGNVYKDKLPAFDYGNMSHKFQRQLPKWQRRI